jgi:hypothetical protein
LGRLLHICGLPSKSLDVERIELWGRSVLAEAEIDEGDAKFENPAWLSALVCVYAFPSVFSLFVAGFGLLDFLLTH